MYERRENRYKFRTWLTWLRVCAFSQRSDEKRKAKLDDLCRQEHSTYFIEI